MQIKVVDMLDEHLDAAHRLEKQNFSEPWSRAALKEALDNKHTIWKAAMLNAETVAKFIADRRDTVRRVRGMPCLRSDMARHVPTKILLRQPPAQIAGYVGMLHVVNEGHIINIAVDASCRRMGVGSRLLEALLDEAARREMLGLTLEVRESNTAARRLYAKYGFEPEGRRKNFYKKPEEDAVIMWRYF